MRRPLIIGNWKLHGSKQLVYSLLSELQQQLPAYYPLCDIVISPPLLFLDQARNLLGINHPLALAAQNIDIHPLGAFTGEIAASLLPEFGVTYVIIGHSERRCYHHETNLIVTEKLIQAKKAGLIPILCLGETAEQRSRGETENICREQLVTILQAAGIETLQNCVIAYEPVWAIGSGQAATPQQAQAVHQFIRTTLAEHHSTIASNLRILYGGSVTEQQAASLYSMPDIDGFLVGGASLKSQSFVGIIQKAIGCDIS